jgi:hypothetical protein
MREILPSRELPPLDLEDVPEHLDSEGRRIWRETGAVLLEWGTLKEPHGAVFEFRHLRIC